MSFALPQPVRALLHERRISNTAIASASGYSPQFVSRVLLGRSKPTARLLAVLTATLEMDAAQLFKPEQLAGEATHPGDLNVVVPS